MQNSIWKLLTAGSIIGIGTLVVFEVQSRIPKPKTAVSNDRGTASGVSEVVGDSIFTPDSSTEFDETFAHGNAVASTAAPRPLAQAHHEPHSVPPADDSEFFGSRAVRTVNKDNAIDSGSAFSMDEPLEFNSDDVDSDDDSPAIMPAAIVRDSTRDAATPGVQPTNFERSEGVSETAIQNTPVSSVVESGPLLSGSPGGESPVRESAPQSSAAAVRTASAVSGSQSGGSRMMFFGNARSPDAGMPAGKTVSNAVSDNPSASTTNSTTAEYRSDSAAGSAGSGRVDLTAATIEDSLIPFVPDPVPDVTQPRQTGQTDSLPEFTLDEFSSDPVTEDRPNRALSIPNRIPASGGDFFTEDPADTPVDRPASGRPPVAGDSLPLPTPEQDTFDNVPFPSDNSSGNSGGASPAFPDRNSGLNRNRDADPFPPLQDQTPDFGRPDRSIDSPFYEGTDRNTPDRNGIERGSSGSRNEFDFDSRQPDRSPTDNRRRDRSGGTLTDEGGLLPFEPDPQTDGGTAPLPLPAADDFPNALPRRPTDPRRPESTTDSESGRTVSEVMRPQLTIQKRAPNAATVGVAHDYTIVVSNEGSSPAYDVVVEDDPGRAAEYVSSRPAAEYDRSANLLVWTFRELRAGEKKEITVRIRPTGEGRIDGIATVKFKAQVKSATIITAPKLELELSGPDEVRVGDEVQLRYTIRNNGSGDAANVILRSVLPPGLKHPEGGDLEYEIARLPAGRSEEIDLQVVAAEPGEHILVSAEVTTSGVSAAKARTELGIVGAQLRLQRLGPERRYVGRSATYQNIVTNESRFEATNAIVVEEVPQGMAFVSCTGGGVFDPDTRRIRWTLPRLAPGRQQILEVVLAGEVAGRMETVVEVTENAGFRTPLLENTYVVIEDIHNVTADISRQDEPVAVGERFGFTVTIDNRGTAVARNVEMSVTVPAELRILAAGTRQIKGKLMPGNVIRYDQVVSIKPNEQMTFQMTLQGERPVRNAVVQASLRYDEMPEPLIVSESVTVFDDRL